MSNFTDTALAFLAGGLPAVADYGNITPMNATAFPETRAPAGTVQNYEPGLLSQQPGLSIGTVALVGGGVAAVLLIIVLATR